jgi:hypothetical protein
MYSYSSKIKYSEFCPIYVLVCSTSILILKMCSISILHTNVYVVVCSTSILFLELCSISILHTNVHSFF